MPAGAEQMPWCLGLVGAKNTLFFGSNVSQSMVQGVVGSNHFNNNNNKLLFALSPSFSHKCTVDFSRGCMTCWLMEWCLYILVL